MYGRVHFDYADHDDPWKAASRFYAAARRRDWWVTKDAHTIYVNDVGQADVQALLDRLGLKAILS